MLSALGSAQSLPSHFTIHDGSFEKSFKEFIGVDELKFLQEQPQKARCGKIAEPIASYPRNLKMQLI
jgi:hypothetical protein